MLGECDQNNLSIPYINPTGTEIIKNSREGGGHYIVIGNINCSRCNTLIEEREVIEPNKKQRKNGSYYYQYSWCHSCGLYEPSKGTKVVKI